MKNKNDYYQVVKGICIILVLLIHTLFVTKNLQCNIFNIIIRRIINFSVPVFIFLAGYFVKYENYKSFYRKKVIRILIPLLIWKSIYALIDIYYIKFNIIIFIKKFILAGFHLYYLVVLALLFLITPFLLNYIDKNKTKVKLLIPIIISAIYDIFLFIFLIIFKKSFPLSEYHIFGWFAFFYIGLLYNRQKISNKFNNKKLFIVCILSLLISILIGLLEYYKLDIYNRAVGQLNIFNLIYSIIVILIIKQNDKIKDNNKFYSFLKIIGDYSYGMYLSHILI